MTIPFGIEYFLPIVATPLEIMGYIFSVNMSYYEHMYALAELSTMTVDSPESNTIVSKNSTLEERIWNILSFENVQ